MVNYSSVSRDSQSLQNNFSFPGSGCTTVANFEVLCLRMLTSWQREGLPPGCRKLLRVRP